MTSHTHSDLLRTIEGYLVETSTTPFAFGQAVVGDPGIVSRLRRGGQLQEATVHLLLDHMIGHLEALLAERAAKAEREERRAEYAAFMDECREKGAVLMPVPLALVHRYLPFGLAEGHA